MEQQKRTPFYALQAARGARFVPFAGYEMPVQFTQVIAEHHAVRKHAGLFDVSHMGEFVVEGRDALAALQKAVTNDVAKLTDGKALYTVMCADHGGIVDDLIVYRESATRFFLCVNASRRADDFAHLASVMKGFDCRLTDESDAWAQLALQGPAAEAILQSLVPIELKEVASFAFVDASVAGVPGVRIARTGYTGEPGFELYVKNSGAEPLWRALDEAGKLHGLALCGLGCRDTLRLEMKYPLYGNDIDLDHNPLEAGLGWVVKFDKGDFVGRAALERVKAEGVKRKWVGLRMLDRGIPRHGYPIRAAGREVGVVTSGTHSPSLNEPIGVGYVEAAHAAVGSKIEVVIRDKPVLAEVCKTPFYKREQP